LQVTKLDMEMGQNLWIECWWRAMMPTFSDCMPLSNRSCCEYLIRVRADPLPSWSTFNHPFVFVVLPRKVIWICVTTSALPLTLGW
jgi:hypothetical protein